MKNCFFKMGKSLLRLFNYLNNTELCTRPSINFLVICLNNS